MGANNNTGRDDKFVRYRGPVTCVAGIPNTNAAVSSAYDGSVAFIDLDSRSMELLGYHDHLTNRITVNDAGTLAASSSSDYTVHLWDLQQRKRRHVLIGHSDDVEDFAFVNDHVGVSVSRDWRILVWNLDTGAILAIEGHEKDVLSVVCSKGRIYTSGDDMTLRVWDMDTGTLVKMWGPFENETDSCAIDAIHGRAVLGCDDGVIRVFDIESSETLAEIKAHQSGIKMVATSPVNGDILSAAYDQKILVWDAKDFEQKVQLERKATTWERSFNWTADGQRILAGTFDGTALIWDANSGQCLDEVGDRGTGNTCLNDVSANEDGEIATVSDDGFIRLGRLTPAVSQWSTQVEPASGRMLANAITMDDAHKVVMSGAHDQKLHIFEKTSEGALGDELEVTIGEGPINCVRVAHHAGYEGQAFVACYSGAIVRVDRTGKILSTIRVHEGAVKALRLHPDQTRGVSCSADGALLSWDFEGNLLEQFPGHTAIVDDVDIDPTGKYVASVSRDFTMNVYRFDDGKLLHSFEIGRRSPKGVCFLDPQTVIITNYWGALLRVDLQSKTILTRQIAENGISAVARSDDRLVAVSYDGVAYLVRSQDLVVENTLRSMQQRLQPSALIRPAAACDAVLT